MGSCMGHCLPLPNLSSNRNEESDFTRLVDEKPVLVEGILNLAGESYSRLNEVQRFPSCSSYNTRDIPLQCLDARALLARTTTSTPASSLDLEWEHEALPLSTVQDSSTCSWVQLAEESTALCGSATNNVHCNDSDWSRVSSADSLEWDNVENSFHGSPPTSDIDTDTQVLLSEIERLTTKALQETGKNIFS